MSFPLVGLASVLLPATPSAAQADRERAREPAATAMPLRRVRVFTCACLPNEGAVADPGERSQRCLHQTVKKQSLIEMATLIRAASVKTWGVRGDRQAQKSRTADVRHRRR